VIIEGAFLKLPETLETMAGGRVLYEPMVAHAMATSVLLELYARNVPFPSQHVTLEKPFVESPKGRPPQVDLFVDLGSSLPSNRLEGYGCRSENWIEVKAYVSSTRKTGPTRRRTEEAGAIVRDLLRVCLLPNEYQGRIRKNARYLLMVHSSDPNDYWSGKHDRTWVADLTRPGSHKLEVPLAHLPGPAVRAIGGGMRSKPLQEFRLHVDNLTFSPAWSTQSGLSRYWGSLTRIRQFSVRGPGWAVSFQDLANSQWTAQDNVQLTSARTYLVDVMRRHGRASCSA